MPHGAVAGCEYRRPAHVMIVAAISCTMSATGWWVVSMRSSSVKPPCWIGWAEFNRTWKAARGTGVQRAELMATDGGRHIYERAGFAAAPWPAMRAAL